MRGSPADGGGGGIAGDTHSYHEHSHIVEEKASEEPPLLQHQLQNLSEADAPLLHPHRHPRSLIVKARSPSIIVEMLILRLRMPLPRPWRILAQLVAVEPENFVLRSPPSPRSWPRRRRRTMIVDLCLSLISRCHPFSRRRKRMVLCSRTSPLLDLLGTWKEACGRWALSGIYFL